MNDLLPLQPPVFHIRIALWDGGKHGYAIMDVKERTGGTVKMGPGTLYGSIKRMLELGLIEEFEPRNPSAADERRRMYRITKLGKQAAQAETQRLAGVLKQAKAYGLVPKRI